MTMVTQHGQCSSFQTITTIWKTLSASQRDKFQARAGKRRRRSRVSAASRQAAAARRRVPTLKELCTRVSSRSTTRQTRPMSWWRTAGSRKPTGGWPGGGAPAGCPFSSGSGVGDGERESWPRPRQHSSERSRLRGLLTRASGSCPVDGAEVSEEAAKS